jgi:mannosyltransferase OCH1-like enzyme
VNVYLNQWKEAHPDYEIRVWGEEDVDRDISKFQLSSILMDRDLNPGLRADALRYEILKLHGGIYVDTDMALVKPIHSLMNGINADLFIGVSHSEAFEVNNAIIGCVPGHPFIDRAIAKLKSTFEA